MKKQKSVREAILDGSFNLKVYNEVNYINPKKKKLEELQCWKQFYLNRCTDGTGNQVEIINKRTNQPMMVDISVNRKVPFQDWMFYPKFRGEVFSFIHKYREQGNGKYLKTSKDLKDDESAYFLELDIKLLQDSQREYFKNRK